MEMPIQGFDVDYFVGALYTFAQEKYAEWASGKTEGDIEELIQNTYPEAADLSEAAQQFYVDYGVDMGMSPNAYFDAGEYRLAWANAQVDQNFMFTVDAALAAYDAEVGEIGGDYAHYLAKGAALGVNPSNDFDESDYLQALIDGLDADMSTSELRDLAIDNDILPLGFFVDYPEFQSEYPAIAVEGDERVEVGDTPTQGDVGQTFTLTAAANAIPGLVGSEGTISTDGDDTIIATDTTLTAGDIIDAGAGYDILRVFQNDNGGNDYAAVEINGVEEIDVTADAGQATLDLSGTRGLELLKTTNSDDNVTFEQVTSLANLFLNETTGEPTVVVEYQDQVVNGDSEIDVTIEDSGVGTVRIGNEDDVNGGIETVNLMNFGDDSGIVKFDTDVQTLNITGTGDITIQDYLNGSETMVEASTFEGDLNLKVGMAIPENNDLDVNSGSGDDILWVAGGQLDVDMGDGDDRVIFDDDTNATNNHGFRSDDVLDGGDGADVLQIGNDAITFGGNFDLSTTEFNSKGSFETVDVRSQVADITLSQGFVDSAQETLTVRSDMVANDLFQAAMVTELDTTELGQNTALQYIGGEGSDRLVLDNATFSSNIDLDGGASHNATVFPATTGDYDTLSVVGGTSKTVIDAPDLANIDNFEGLNLVKPSSAAANVVFDIELTEAFLLNNTEATNSAATTTINDTVFQMFSEDIQGGGALGGGDTVNIDISDLLNANGTLKGSLVGRGLDFTDLINTGATINFEASQIDAGVITQAAAQANVTSVDAVGQVDVIASRANPVNLPNLDNILNTQGVGFNTTSGFLIEDGNIATSGDDILNVTNFAHLNGATVNMGGGNDVMNIQTVVNAPTDFSNLAVFPNAASIEEVVLEAGSSALVTGAAGQDITAEAAAIFQLTGTGEGQGSSAGDTITAAATGSIMFGNGGNDVMNAGAAADTIDAGEGNDTIDLTLVGANGNDLVVAGNGADTVNLLHQTTGSDDLYLGDVTWTGNAVTSFTTDADIDTVTINNGAPNQVDTDHVDIFGFGLNDVLVTQVGGIATSNGVFVNNATGVGAPAVTNLALASVLEVASSSYTYAGALPDETALLAHMTGTMGVTGAANSVITVVAYDASGDAALFQAQETDGAVGAFDAIELLGVIDSVGADALTAGNFA